MSKQYTREEYIYLAKLYEKAERFNDMVKFINKFIEMNPELSHEERIILSAGYKNVISSKRSSWRLVNTLIKKEDKSNTQAISYLNEEKSIIEKEIEEICKMIQNIIDKYLIPNAKDSESKVFYLKLKGDYFRYVAEYSIGKEFNAACDSADKAYREAYEIAEKDLPIVNTTRLGVSLNFSIFYYEVRGLKEEGCIIAKNAFNEAMKILDDLERVKAKDSLLLIQLLKENLILWENEMNDEE